jgi:SRR1
VQPAIRWVLRDKFTLERVAQPYPEDLETAARFFRQSLQNWERSELWAIISTLLRTKLFYKIDKIIGFACGRFSRTDQETQTQRSAAQHAMLLMTRDLVQLTNQSPGTTACYAQDPAYSPVDTTILSEHDVTVLEDPDAFLEADEASIVLSFAPNVPVRQIIMDVTRPAVLIWDKIDEKEVIDSPSEGKR